MNFIEGTLLSADARQAQVQLADGSRVRFEVDATRATAGDAVALGVRPEHLQPATANERDNTIDAQVTFVDRLGATSFVYFDFPKAEASLTAELPGPARVRAGDAMTLALPAGACYLFDAQGLAFARTASPHDAQRAA